MAPSPTTSPVIPVMIVTDGQSLWNSSGIPRSLFTDSHADRTWNQMRRLLPGMKVVNVAQNGTRIDQLATTVASRVYALNTPTVTTLVWAFIGANSDILFAEAPASVYAELIDYADGVRAAGFDYLVAATMPPGALYNAGGFDDEREAFNALLVADGVSDGLDAVVDINVPPLTTITSNYFLGDDTHPSTLGAAVIAQAMATAIDSLLP